MPNPSINLLTLLLVTNIRIGLLKTRSSMKNLGGRATGLKRKQKAALFVFCSDKICPPLI